MILQAEEAKRAAKVDAALATVQSRIDALLARKAQLESRRIGVATPEAATPEAPKATTRASRAAGDQRWKTTKYLFWQAYQRQFKIPAHTQAILTATCAKHGIDQAVPSVATLTKVRDLLNGK